MAVMIKMRSQGLLMLNMTCWRIRTTCAIYGKARWLVAFNRHLPAVPVIKLAAIPG
ncbi:hypothetical protein [Nitratireductor sp. XY-223]|uniref:hypothetical protein n=1 Tax=Nitratireductor sp. XY-223 TaxID=2561926 RepID=UPI00145A5475|nr:hypothetical protein [Nitratireductor sp. XY-223]